MKKELLWEKVLQELSVKIYENQSILVYGAMCDLKKTQVCLLIGWCLIGARAPSPLTKSKIALCLATPAYHSPTVCLLCAYRTEMLFSN